MITIDEMQEWGGNRKGAGRKKKGSEELAFKVGISMDKESFDKLDALAKRWNCTRSEAVRKLILKEK